MTIIIKNKHTLLFDDFVFKCCVGKKGFTKNKVEGDKKTPIGTYSLENIYFRKDKVLKPVSKIKCFEIKRNMKWCDDISSNIIIKRPIEMVNSDMKSYIGMTTNMIILFQLNTIGKNPNLQKEVQYLFT